MTVTKAVIPAAGLGTRFLPATKSQAKEMIPIVDKPAIQYVVEEAVRAGLDDILIITSRGKAAMEDHFDRSLELERHLEATGKKDELALVREIGSLANVHFVRQKEPRGFGDAVLAARSHVGTDAFALLVGDEIVPDPRGDEPRLLERMIDVFEHTGRSVVAVQIVPDETISSYGVVALRKGTADVADHAQIEDMIEKPPAEDAPSNLAARGRYLLTADIFDAIARTSEGVGGEIQLTDAIRILAREQGVEAFVHSGPIYDVGKKLDYLRATIELTLRRDDLAGPFRDWLVKRVTDL